MNFQIIKRTGILFLALVELTLSASATENTEVRKDKIFKLPDFVVTASKYQEAIRDLAPNVYVSSNEAIVIQNFLNFEEVLMNQPGIFLVSNGGTGTLTSLFSRGGESNHTSILLNGRRLPSGQSGQYDLGQLSLVNASSVEMILGDASSLYGGGSIGGVINIRSDITASNIGQSYSLRAGTYSSEASYSRVSAKGSNYYSFGLSSLYDNGYQPNAYFRRNSTNFYYNKTVNNKLNLDLQVYAYDSSLGVPGSTNTTWPAKAAYPQKEKNNTDTYLISPGLQIALNENIKFKSILNFTSNDLVAINTPSIVPEIDNLDYSYLEETSSFDNYFTISNLRQSIKSIMGFSYEDKKYELDPIGSDSGRVTIRHGYKTESVYGKSTINLDEYTVLSLSGRYSKFSQFFESKKSGAIEVSRSLNDANNSKIFISSSYGFTPLDAIDMIYLSSVDDTKFKHEVMRSNVIGYKAYNEAEKSEFGISIFSNQIYDIADFKEIYDPITVASDENGNPVPSEYGEGYNWEWPDPVKVYSTADTKQKGFEIYYKKEFLNDLQLSMGYSYLDASITNGALGGSSIYIYEEGFGRDNSGGVYSAEKGDQVIRRPMHKINLSLLYPINSQFDLGLNMMGAIDREDVKDYSLQTIEDICNLRIYGNYYLSDSGKIFFTINNALNDEYDWTPGYPNQPRSIDIGARFNF
ncbi:MAG: TonB-dependent receptor plug domain-containing protein [Coraliomargaritaceae bacterium]